MRIPFLLSRITYLHCRNFQRPYIFAILYTMNEMFDSWPWDTPGHQSHQAAELERVDSFDVALSSDVLADLNLPLPSTHCDAGQPSFGLDEDLFAHIDDFILFPDHLSVEIWPLEESKSSQRIDGATSTQSSPVSSTNECVSSPSTSQPDILDQEQHRTSTNTNRQRNQRRRRTATVFPCALCTRVCFTSVEAR